MTSGPSSSRRAVPGELTTGRAWASRWLALLQNP